MRLRISLSAALLTVGTSALAFHTIDYGGEPARWPDARCTMYHDPSWSASPGLVSELKSAPSAKPWSTRTAKSHGPIESIVR